MKRNILVILLAVVTFFSTSLFSYAYYARFIITPPIIELSLGPGESAAREFTITYDPNYQNNVDGEAPYAIDRSAVCENEEYDTDGNCLYLLPNLCSYLTFTPLGGEAEDIGLDPEGGSDGYPAILGGLNRPVDESDIWQVNINLPSSAQNGQSYHCFLEVVSRDIGIEGLVASFGLDAGSVVEVVVNVGGAPIGNLSEGVVDPEVGTASSTPFIFSVSYDENSPVNVVVDGDQYQMEQNGEIFTLEKQFPTGDYQYHFEASGTRFPLNGELTFRSGLFITPKASARIRTAPGLNSAVFGVADHDSVIELDPLCTTGQTSDCNDPSAIYQLIDNHYWLRGRVGNIEGYLAEDLLMTIIPTSQPERVKEKMEEIFTGGDFDTLLDAEFPLELLLAISAHESGGTLNNEVVSGDSPFSGIMQVHPRTSGQNDNCLAGVCARPLSFPSDWEGLEEPFTDLFGISTYDHNGIVYMFKNYINTQYSNSKQGLENNVTDGLTVLQDAKYRRCDNSDIAGNVWSPITWDGYTFSVPELKQICATWLYNGQDYKENNPYLRHIGESLDHLNNVFPGTVYSNEDNFIEKLKIANNHRAEIKVKSPVELRVKDGEGNTTGLVDENVVNEIPNAVYDEVAEAVVVFFPEGELTYQVQGTADGTYGLDITETDRDEEIIFSAPAIPITEGVIHEIELDEAGEIVTIHVDEDADGLFDDQFVVNPADTRPPEMEIFFDFDTNHYFLSGVDNFPGVEKTSTPSKTTFTDAVGHTLEVNWSTFDIQPQKVNLGIENLVYNGATTTFPSPVTFSYEWWKNAVGRITKFESKGEVPGIERALGTYKWSGTTYFKKFPANQPAISSSLAGAAALSLSTRNGIIHLGWPGLPQPIPLLLEPIPLEDPINP